MSPRQKASLAALAVLAVAVFVGAPLLVARSLDRSGDDSTRAGLVVVEPGASGWELDARGSLELLARHLSGDAGLDEQARVVESISVVGVGTNGAQRYSVSDATGSCWSLDAGALERGVEAAPADSCRRGTRAQGGAGGG